MLYNLTYSRTGSTVEFLNVIDDNNETPEHYLKHLPNASRDVMISNDIRNDHLEHFQLGHQTMTLPGNRSIIIIVIGVLFGIKF